jgi:hypothetical protein
MLTPLVTRFELVFPGALTLVALTLVALTLVALTLVALALVAFEA